MDSLLSEKLRLAVRLIKQIITGLSDSGESLRIIIIIQVQIGINRLGNLQISTTSRIAGLVCQDHSKLPTVSILIAVAVHISKFVIAVLRGIYRRILFTQWDLRARSDRSFIPCPKSVCILSLGIHKDALDGYNPVRRITLYRIFFCMAGAVRAHLPSAFYDMRVYLYPVAVCRDARVCHTTVIASGRDRCNRNGRRKEKCTQCLAHLFFHFSFSCFLCHLISSLFRCRYITPYFISENFS